MHEFSIASQAVENIVKVSAEKKAKKICGVEFLIGEASMIGREQFLYWIKELHTSKVDIAHHAAIDVQSIEIIIRCRQCGYDGGLSGRNQDHFNPIFECPACGIEDVEIKQGRECILKRIQLEI